MAQDPNNESSKTVKAIVARGSGQKPRIGNILKKAGITDEEDRLAPELRSRVPEGEYKSRMEDALNQDMVKIVLTEAAIRGGEIHTSHDHGFALLSPYGTQFFHRRDIPDEWGYGNICSKISQAFTELCGPVKER
jgi:hypothetical protein